MIYDHQVNMSEVHAPVQANVIIRSQSGQNSKRQPQRYTSVSARNKSSESRKTFGAMNGQRFDIEKFTSYLQGITRSTSTQKCARSIRVGLQSSGAKIVNHPVAAADWGNTLQQLGYRKINLSFDRPKKGDIYIMTGLHSISMVILQRILVRPGFLILNRMAMRSIVIPM
jgi:hypothetical protein